MRADEVLGGIWSFIKYEVVKWYWMRRDHHHTGWMVLCSLQPVYAKKYVEWKQEGYIDLWKQSWNVRKRLDNIRQNLSPYQLSLTKALAGWCRVLSSRCTLKTTWSGSWKGKCAWTFDCLFFSTDGLCRDVDAGVLVMYTSLPAGEEFSSVFTCFPLLGCVFLWEMVWCGVYILFFVFLFLFCSCCYSVYHTVPLVSFLQSCTFLGHIGMQGICMAYCYRCSLVCLSVCWIQPWAMQKRINWSRCRLGCVRLGSGSPEKKGQCWGHVPPRY